MPSETQPDRTQSNRCTYLSPSGRRCRSLISPDHESFCLFHAHRDDPFDETEHRTPEAKAVVAQVLGTRESFKTATQVNEALAKLFALRARKLISQSDAYFLAYACQLMLFSLHSVKNDFTQTYELNQWEKLVERALRAHSANLPPLELGAAPRSTLSSAEGPTRQNARITNPPTPKIIFQIPPATSDAVIPRSADSSGTTRNLSSSVTNALEPGRPPGSTLSPAEGPTTTVDSDPLPTSKSLLRKQKRRALAKTGREFASQVFDDLAASRAERKKRTLAHFGESQQHTGSVQEREEIAAEVDLEVGGEAESEPEEGVENAPAHW